MSWARVPRSKYGAKKTQLDGIEFDSRKEARRWAQLRLMEKAGEITDLQRQVKFVLIPAQREPDTIGPKGGIKKGRLLEKECAYYADFTYKDALPFADPAEMRLHVEDTKGMRTAEYIIKRKLMLHIYGIRIEEI